MPINGGGQGLELALENTKVEGFPASIRIPSGYLLGKTSIIRTREVINTEVKRRRGHHFRRSVFRCVLLQQM